ncbi:hypothetical protein HDV03_002264 [Kappamyces sp. JEL0829]|nr:hypothetical protein HDV03_002264 [Kappamyces sp. JEL0829]
MEAFHSLIVKIRGINYYLIDEGHNQRGWVLLLHGFPDLALGWKHQIAALARAGYRVVAPDMVGFGDTDAPEDLQRYGFQSVAHDMVALMDYLGCHSAFYIGCHDWGGMAGWRLAQYYPERVRGLLSFCTSFQPTHSQWIPDEKIVSGAGIDCQFKILPNLAYQGVFALPQTDALMDANVDQVFDYMFHHNPSLLEPNVHPLIASLKGPPLAKAIDTSKHKEKYKRRGFHGGLNWYRTRRLNYDQEKQALAEGTMTAGIRVPCMLVVCLRDPFLTPKMSRRIHEYIPRCSIAEMDATHWVLVENDREATRHLLQFFGSLDGKSETKPLKPKL